MFFTKNLTCSRRASLVITEMKYRHIIWDWNGTVVDDARVSFTVFNEIATSQNLPSISFEDFRDKFGFPVIDFYKAHGFDFDKLDFREIGRIFIERYYQLLPKNPVYPVVRVLLPKLKELGLTHSVLSAHKVDTLRNDATAYDLAKYFDIIDGLADDDANSKTELGRAHIEKFPYKKSEILMLGDTLHDKASADAMGVDCALIAKGYCSKVRLKATGVPVFDSHEEFFQYLLKIT